MNSYRDRRGQPPDFRVEYSFRPPTNGVAPRQHIRCDFMYEGDDPQIDGISMIWPEFLDERGGVRPEGAVPLTGIADMFVVDPERRPFHLERLREETRGHFMMGATIIADCVVVQIVGLPHNPVK